MKNNNKKKRVLPLLLALLLLISAGAYGTRAFFKDDEELKTSIKIETGKLEITSAETEEWKYVPLADSSINLDYILNDKLLVSSTAGGPAITPKKSGDSIGNEAYITQARPGDAFERKFTFKNTGNLDLKMTFDTNLESVISDDFVVEFTNNNNDVKILTPGDAVTYILKISVRTGLTNTDGLNEHVLNYIDKYLKIDATQPNAK